jgi:predicted NBD/HSP70 family sugar kinase
MEAPMKRSYFIGLDTHGQFCAMAVVDTKGRLVKRDSCASSIVALRHMLGQVSGRRLLVIEELVVAQPA